MRQQGSAQGEQGLCLLQDLSDGEAVLQVFCDQGLQLLHPGAALLLQHVEFTPEEEEKTSQVRNVFPSVHSEELRLVFFRLIGSLGRSIFSPEKLLFHAVLQIKV